MQDKLVTAALAGLIGLAIILMGYRVYQDRQWHETDRMEFTLPVAGDRSHLVAIPAALKEVRYRIKSDGLLNTAIVYPTDPRNRLECAHREFNAIQDDCDLSPGAALLITNVGDHEVAVTITLFAHE